MPIESRNWQVESLYDHHVIRHKDDRFICQIEGQEIPLVFAVEVINLYDVGITDNPDYCLGLQWHIFVAESHVSERFKRKAMGENAYDDPDCEYNIYDAMTHGGGIPVSPWNEVDRDKEISDIDFETDSYDGKEYPNFDSYNEVEKFVEAMLPRLNAISGMVGFWLDRPVNRMGTTGWEMLENQLTEDEYSPFKATLERRTA